MAVPVYDAFYSAILELLADGETHTSKETIGHCADVFHLDQADREEMLESGRQTVLANRVGWARTYLKKAGLISSPSKGKYQITDAGKAALKDAGSRIDNDYLLRFESFRDFTKAAVSSDEDNGKGSSVAALKPDEERTPSEMMDLAYRDINRQLADDLMTMIMQQSPAFFEKLVVELLKKMGYGDRLERSGEVTGKAGDEGIDGIVREDTLGFDKIYVQAKRWSDDHAVGEPDIQQFAGALMGMGATKGLFITTSHFSRQAVSYVEKHMSAKIVLVDGEKLTGYMIQYGLGVSTTHVYEIRRVDSDYFDEEDE